MTPAGDGAAAGLDGLEAFVPELRTVRAGGCDVVVRPLTLRQLPLFARAVEPLLPALLSGQVIPALVADPDRLVAAVAAATALPEAEIRDLDPAEFVRLVAAVVEVNVDFFARSLLPATRAAEAAILARAASLSTGPSSSPGSASADTRSTI
jgi:hypothetical protein